MSIFALCTTTVCVGFMWRAPVARIVWSYQLPGTASDTHIYNRPGGGCYAVSEQGALHVFNADGMLLKQYSLPQGDQFSLGVLSEQGNLIIGSGKQAAVYAFDPLGNMLWKCSIPPDISLDNMWAKCRRSTPFLSSDGKLNVTITSGEFAVLSQQGQIVYRYLMHEPVFPFGSPALIPGGGFYISELGHELNRFTQEGNRMWKLPVATMPAYHFACAPDGTAFVLIDEAELRAYKPDRTVRWKYGRGEQPPHDRFYWKWFTADTDNTLYAASNQWLAAFSSNGTLKWRSNLTADSFNAFIGRDKLYVQASCASLSNDWNQFVYTLPSQFPIPIQVHADNPRKLLYIFDKKTGTKSQAFILPQNTVLKTGPGTDNQFYGVTVTKHKSISHRTVRLVRIDLP